MEWKYYIKQNGYLTDKMKKSIQLWNCVFHKKGNCLRVKTKQKYKI